MSIIFRIIVILLLCFNNFIIFAQSPNNADLPDALTFLNGKKVKTMSEFNTRKAEIKKLWCKYFIGNFPSKTPKVLSADVIKNDTMADGSIRKRIIIKYDTPHKKSFEIALWQPPKRGKYPLLLTQPRYYQIPWAEEALKRGYMVCLYPGLDTHHNEKDYPDYQNVWKIFKEEYPEATWSSSLGIQAWLASRTLDYLLDPRFGYNIDKNSIGIIGHSRYGKQSIYAGAFDDRIKCIIARSSGTPTACSYRFASRQTFMESVNDFPEAWALPGLRQYYGKENELPIEGNSLLAVIAPRNLLMHSAYNDGSDPTFGVERNYLNAKKAYQLLGKPENIRLCYRFGGHDPITKEHVIFNIDYFDLVFNRNLKSINKSVFDEKLLHRFDWNEWKNKQRRTDILYEDKSDIKERINWMLGEQPVKIEHEDEYYIKKSEELGIENWSRDRWNPDSLKRVTFSFGAKMHGNIYFDPKISKYKGTIIWLHPWNYSHGSNEAYGVEGTTIYWRLAKEGYIVAAYDQFGFGEHLLDAVDFYEKYPHWSKLGRAVYDVKKALDFLIDGKGITSSPIPKTDPKKIYVLGFSYGGMVALYSAALDNRIKGVASFSGFTPMRSDNDKKPTGGIRKYFEWYNILPKLGFFNGKENKIPYDYDDVIKIIAPRKCLIYAPAGDRFADIEDITRCMEKVKPEWKNPDDFLFLKPAGICRFQKDQQDVFIKWMERMVTE
jgi:pimeloyl-ACP methyl ester carboxylesterase